MSPTLRFGAISALCLLVIGAIGAWPTFSATGEAGLRSLAVAAVAALSGAIVGYLPLARAKEAPLDQKAQAALVGVVLRLVATGAAVGIVVVLGVVDRRTFLVWTAIDYVALLAVETRLAISLARTSGTASA